VFTYMRTNEGCCCCDQGPLTAMDAVELQHWMHIAATRAAVAAVTASHDLIDKSKRRVTEDQRQFQVPAW